MQLLDLNGCSLIAVALSLLLGQGPVNASEVEQNAAKVSASDWRKHANLSYQEFESGNTVAAVKDGEEAVKLNPKSAVALINLALMKQRTKMFDEAISLYWQAAQLLPNSWVPPIGIARSYIMRGNEADGRAVLDMMASMSDRDFDWYYITAKTWLEIDDPAKAAVSASLAAQTRSNPDQKAAAESLQMLALLREGNADQAKALQEKIFRADAPRNSELYVRTAMSLLPASDPAQGKELLSRTVKTVGTAEGAEPYLQLALVFKEKSEESKDNPNRQMQWLGNAQAACEQSLAIDPKTPDTHFAMATIYSCEGKSKQAADELKSFSGLDRTDILAPVLIPPLEAANGSVSQAVPVSLALVKFKIDGLTCGCHLSKVHQGLRRINGVAFISTPPGKPYTGSLMVDPTQTSPRDLISQFNHHAFPPPPAGQKDPEIIKLEMVSEEPIKLVSKALEAAGAIKFSSALKFTRTYSDYLKRFQEVRPIMPDNETSTTNGVTTASTWVAPL